MRVRHPFVEAELDLVPGEVVAVVGPNGAGKTSLLRGLAGLDGCAPPGPVGWVPQRGSLFSMSALDNAAFALRAKGISRREARRQAQSWLDRLGIGDLASRRPEQLSGGQAARVALARALAGEPTVLLLDEPLAALDATTRDDVRRLLRSVLSGGPAAVLVVTHDPVDVVALADRLLVLEAGAVVQTGTVAEVAAAPRTAWVAGLLGQNAWTGTTTSRGLQVGSAELVVADPLAPGLPALALCEPAAVTLHRAAPEGSARNVLTGPLGDLRNLGGRVRVTVDSTPPVVAEVTVAAAADLGLADGGQVWAAVKATELRLVAR